MKILFFGSKGWIGRQFCEYLNEKNILYIESDLRADNEKDVEKEINEYNPTHIISFIGRTYGDNFNTIDYLEQPGKLVENIRDNLYAPIILSILCERYNIHYTYMGTGCIFEYNEKTHLYGNVETGFLETDLPNFFGSSYSIVKGYTDRLMQLLYSDFIKLTYKKFTCNGLGPERGFIFATPFK